jgi:hypothetical protein
MAMGGFVHGGGDHCFALSTISKFAYIAAERVEWVYCAR